VSLSPIVEVLHAEDVGALSKGGASMQFRVLGSLEVRVDDRLVQFGVPKRRILLLALLSQANAVVSVDRLTDWLWPEDPPRTAVSVVQAHISHLRRAIEPDRERRGPSRLLVTCATGYLVKVTSDQLDALRFERLVELGRNHLSLGDFAAAAAVLTDAMSLWRGPALADADGIAAARAFAVRWEELRQFASVMRIEAQLELGRHLCVVSELEYLVEAHPFDERLHGLLMIALYRSRRRADALFTYRKLRQTLYRELGANPAPALRRLEHAIRSQAPELDTSSPRTLV
jgi:DNA-binding SARP family transcriptional activator